MGLLDKFLGLFEDKKQEIQMVYCQECFWIRASNVTGCEGCVYFQSWKETQDFIAASRQRLWELKHGISYDEFMSKHILDKNRKEMQWHYF